MVFSMQGRGGGGVGVRVQRLGVGSVGFGFGGWIEVRGGRTLGRCVMSSLSLE